MVGALVRLGRCLDLLDPTNTALLRKAREDLERTLDATGQSLPSNANNHKYMDCAVFNWLFEHLEDACQTIDSCRAVFVPLQEGKMPRLWTRSGVFEGAHVQVSVRRPDNILAVWPVRKDGRYGEDA